MSRVLALWNDFSKGEAGWTDKNRVALGYFTGQNMMVYRDGNVGPRSGVVSLVPTGFPAGTIFDMGYIDTGNSGDEYLWIRKGTTLARVRVYQASGTLLHVVTGQAFTADATAFASAAVGDSVDYEKVITLVTIAGDKCYKLNWSAAPGAWNSAIAGSPGGRCIEVYGDQVVVGNVTSHPNRLVFSKQADYTTWPAANFLDVGNAGNAGVGGAPNIIAIRKVKDQLLVFADTGQVWVITGLLGAKSTTVREFMVGDRTTGPGSPDALARDRAGGIWWTRREEIVAAGQSWDNASAMPITYMAGVRGDVPNQAGFLRQPGFVSNRSSDTIAFTPRNDKSVILADRAPNDEWRALVYRDGVWTRHDLALGNTGFILASCAGSRGDVYVASLNISGSAPQIHAWQAEFEQPTGPYSPFASGTSILPVNALDQNPLGGDSGIITIFATPEYRDPAFGVVAVEGIEILFSSYPYDGVTKNHADVYLQQYDASNVAEKVFNIGLPEDYDVTGGPPGTFTPPYGVTIPMAQMIDELGPNADSVRRRVRLYPESGQGKPTTAFRVLLRNVFNIKIHEIVVFGDSTAADRR